jgi:hypothetical protein
MAFRPCGGMLGLGLSSRFVEVVADGSTSLPDILTTKFVGLTTMLSRYLNSLGYGVFKPPSGSPEPASL